MNKKRVALLRLWLFPSANNGRHYLQRVSRRKCVCVYVCVIHTSIEKLLYGSCPSVVSTPLANDAAVSLLG